MIRAGRYDFVIQQGAKFQRNLTYKDSTGNVIDLSGYSARMEIREDHEADSIIGLSTGNGRIVLGGALGTIQLNLTSAETLSLDFDVAEYDLFLVSPAGEETMILSGFVTLIRRITQVVTETRETIMDFSGPTQWRMGLWEDTFKMVKEKVKRCSICNNLSEVDPCSICNDEKRDRTTICVVEEPQDVLLFEKIREYHGLYHVLGGAISPLKGINPEDLTIGLLLNRLKDGNIEEVIVATDPDAEGEATAIYISRLLHPLKIKVTRLAHGLPSGGDLEFADEITLVHALRGRREI